MAPACWTRSRPRRPLSKETAFFAPMWTSARTIILAYVPMRGNIEQPHITADYSHPAFSRSDSRPRRRRRCAEQTAPLEPRCDAEGRRQFLFHRFRFGSNDGAATAAPSRPTRTSYRAAAPPPRSPNHSTDPMARAMPHKSHGLAGRLARSGEAQNTIISAVQALFVRANQYWYLNWDSGCNNGKNETSGATQGADPVAYFASRIRSGLLWTMDDSRACPARLHAQSGYPLPDASWPGT